MNILVTGATGLIGKQLGIELVKRGHHVVAITRNKSEALLNAPFPADWLETNLSKDIPDLANYSLDGVIHLAGESVGEKSWSESQKTKIKESRSKGTKNLVAALKNQKNLKFFVGASAVGFYDHTQGDFFATEETPKGAGFLAEVTEAWEQASEGLENGVRRVLFRIGVVLSTEGGALPKMLFPARIFSSSALGSGFQWMSWVHIKDVLNAFIFAIENSSLNGIYNLVSPESSQQKEVAKHIALRLNALSGPPVPKFMLRTFLGEQASLALNSLRVSGHKLVDAGFKFEFQHLSRALKDLLQDWSNGHAVKIYRQFFPLPRDQVFQFFSQSKNLEKITPELLHFKITGTSTETMQKGTLIDYKLRIRGFPASWTTEIIEWSPPTHFTDTQLKGPYSFWAHTHEFEELAGGTLMKDTVRYKVPVGLIGRMTTQAWVDSDIEQIFDYRRKNVGKFL
jgi:uncharacterized protein